ncbi:MAG: hypothetical protein ACRDGW_02840 [Actinomycetota bacterium]
MAMIRDFLDKLVDDPDLEAQFEEDPKRAMLEFGLTADQGLLILGGTIRELRDAIRKEAGGEAIVIMGRMV